MANSLNSKYKRLSRRREVQHTPTQQTVLAIGANTYVNTTSEDLASPRVGPESGQLLSFTGNNRKKRLFCVEIFDRAKAGMNLENKALQHRL